MITNINELPEFEAMRDGGYITARKHPSADLYIYNYTAKAQYDNVWNETTLTCRGLICDGSGNVVSRPFRKFFNLEQVQQLPDEPFEVYEKMDGSLIVSYWLDGNPHLATRGSFESDQSKEANKFLVQSKGYPLMMREYTYLFEWLAPDNKIVVNYGDRRELVLLAVVNTATGKEIDFEYNIGFSVSKSYSEVTDINSLKSLILPNAEGFVIRFASGFRVKVKLAEYVRLHKLLTGVTEKTILEDYLMTGANLDSLLDRVPDEFNAWVKDTVANFQAQYLAIERAAHYVFDVDASHATTRKEYAQVFTKTPYSAILFNMLDGKDYSQAIWKMLKPKRMEPFKKDEI